MAAGRRVNRRWMTTAVASRFRRTAELARKERDRARSARTWPARTRSLRWDVAPGALLPAMEPHTWWLHVRLDGGDTSAREELVRRYEAHARVLARRFYRHREPLEDLVQVALEALLLALGRFEPDRRMPFLGFANPTIVGSLKRYYRDAGWAMRVPRRVHELTRPVREAADLLHQDLGRAPTSGEIADLLGISEDRVLEALDATSVRSVASLDAPVTTEASSAVQRGLASTDPLLRLVENRTALGQVVELLDEDDRLLIDRYFGQSMSQQAIATLTGVSQMQVSRSLARVLRRLRSHLPPETS
jgi:RNA polymerase sigma-B factor